MLNTIETIYVSTFFFLSSTTTKFNLLHLMFLITVVVFLSILLPFLNLYNPFSTQQPEKSFYVINWIMLLCVLNLRMKFKPLCLAYTDLQDLALASLYNLISHWSSPPPTVLQPRCTLCFMCSSNTLPPTRWWFSVCSLLVFLWWGSSYHWDFISATPQGELP